MQVNFKFSKHLQIYRIIVNFIVSKFRFLHKCWLYYNTVSSTIVRYESQLKTNCVCGKCHNNAFNQSSARGQCRLSAVDSVWFGILSHSLHVIGAAGTHLLPQNLRVTVSHRFNQLRFHK